MNDDEQYPVKAPGWAALDRAMGMLYPGQTPHQYASQTGYDLESPNPLPAISVYEGRGPDHWHYVTYGLTELFEKSSSRADMSGFGFELTVRVPRAETEEQPPSWPLNMLQSVGGHVLSTREPLDSGHMIGFEGPLTPEQETALCGVICTPDPLLGKLDTPHGSVLFLQLVGLLETELKAMHTWTMERKVGVVRECEPLGITRLERQAWAKDERRARTWRRYAFDILV